MRCHNNQLDRNQRCIIGRSAFKIKQNKNQLNLHEKSKKGHTGDGREVRVTNPHRCSKDFQDGQRSDGETCKGINIGRWSCEKSDGGRTKSTSMFNKQADELGLGNSKW